MFSSKKIKTITLFAKEVLIIKKEEEQEQIASDSITIDADCKASDQEDFLKILIM